MLPASTSGDPKERTPADNQTVRNVFVVGPDKTIKLVLVRELLARRGATTAELEAHDREAERLRRELMRRLLSV